MPRLNTINPAQAEGKAQTLLNNVQKALGATPNIFTTMANAPAALEGYLNFNGALSSGTLSPQLREKIALATASYNGCNYCASAHSFLGDKAGIDADEITHNLSGASLDAKDNAALGFARRLLEERGRVSEADIQQVQSAGFTDEEVIEILAHVALNIFTNYFNEAFKTDIDFPQVDVHGTQAAA